MATINKFGRLPAPSDGRDFRFLMRNMAPQVHEALSQPHPRTLPYKEGPILDQGDTPQCVAYAGRGFLEGAPVMSKPGGAPTPQALYDGAQANDEWPGANYDGTSVRGLMKALQALGLISAYAWGQTLDEAGFWIGDDYGTLIAGTNWYAEMSHVDAQGVMLEPASSLSTPIGGHSYRVVWYSKGKDLWTIRNSWGPWGMVGKNGKLTGEAKMRGALLQRLLNEEGELAAPTQVRLTPVKP